MLLKYFTQPYSFTLLHLRDTYCTFHSAAFLYQLQLLVTFLDYNLSYSSCLVKTVKDDVFLHVDCLVFLKLNR